jgi:hypothetical protein
MEEAENVPASKDYLKLKGLIKRFYLHKNNTTKKIIALYS